MRSILITISLLLLVGSAAAQVEDPDDVYKINNAVFAHYQKTDLTKVMATVATLFDNHSEVFPVSAGAQTLKLYLIYEFKGRELKSEPSSITLGFGSVAGLPARYARAEQRQFRLRIDGVEVLQVEAQPETTVPTPYVTYEDLSVAVPTFVIETLVSTGHRADLTIGSIRYQLTQEDINSFSQFLAALKRRKQETSSATPTQSIPEDTLTTLVETAYQVLPSYLKKYKVIVAIVAGNPFEHRFASHPTVRVTVRGSDGSVITTRELNSAGIPPKSQIAFCESLYADELPAKVEFRPLDAGYEASIYKPSEFLAFELVGVRARADSINRVRVTGEIKNPYAGDTGVWITFLYRDAAGKLLGGHTSYESSIPAGDPTPFEVSIDADEIPTATKSTEYVVFDHNNFQRSWQKLLRH